MRYGNVGFMSSGDHGVPMNNLADVVEQIQSQMIDLEQKRELSLSMSRQIVRKTKRIIHALHQGEDYGSMMEEAKKEMVVLQDALLNHPQILYSGAVNDAMMELAETALLVTVAEKLPLPTPEELRITPASWVLGLGDTVGELRRSTLDLLRQDKILQAEEMLRTMEDLFAALLEFDSPDAILPARRKQDIARSLVEKTRADVTAGVMMRRSRQQ